MSKRIVVQHDWYGCDTGCCGTKFVFEDDEIEMHIDWEFDVSASNKRDTFALPITSQRRSKSRRNRTCRTGMVRSVSTTR